MADTFAVTANLDTQSYAAGASMVLTASGTVTSGGTNLPWAIVFVSDNLRHQWTIQPDGKSATAKA